MSFKVLIVCMVGVTALCSCTATSNGDIDVYDTEYREHDYLIFENGQSGSITVVHSPDCGCKTNKQE